jgi:hypothetical protein
VGLKDVGNVRGLPITRCLRPRFGVAIAPTIATVRVGCFHSSHHAVCQASGSNLKGKDGLVDHGFGCKNIPLDSVEDWFPGDLARGVERHGTITSTGVTSMSATEVNNPELTASDFGVLLEHPNNFGRVSSIFDLVMD